MYKQCTESNENSIKFFLSNADKGAVGFILAQELATLTLFYLGLTTQKGVWESVMSQVSQSQSHDIT